MSAVVDEGDAVGGVIDEYFAFMYEESTEEGISTCSEAEDDLLEVDDVEGVRIQPVGGDLLLPKSVEESGPLIGTISRDLLISKDSSRSLGLSGKAGGVSEDDSEELKRVPEIGLSKHKGAHDVSTEGAAQNFIGSAFKKFKSELLAEPQELDYGARSNNYSYGATVNSDNGESPSTISISISNSPSFSEIISPSHYSSTFIGDKTFANSDVSNSNSDENKDRYDTGGHDDRGGGTGNSILHLSSKIPTKPEVFEELQVASNSCQEGVKLPFKSLNEEFASRNVNSHSRISDINFSRTDFQPQLSYSNSNNDITEFSDISSRSSDSNSHSRNTNSQSTDSQCRNGNSQSIYVNGGDEEQGNNNNNNINNWNTRSSSVYLNGSENMAFGFQFPEKEVDNGRTNPVSIKVSLSSSTFSPDHQPVLEDKIRYQKQILDQVRQHETSNINPVLEQFLLDEEGTQDVFLGNTRPKPVSVYQVNNYNSNNHSDVLSFNMPPLNSKCDKVSTGDLACDFIGNNMSDKVLDIGAIECNILDELFEGMKVKNEMKERLNLNTGNYTTDNNALPTLNTDDNENHLSEIPTENFFDLVTNSEWNDQRDIVNNESRVGNIFTPNEECFESLVESWQYIPGSDDNSDENNDRENVRKGIEKEGNERENGNKDTNIEKSQQKVHIGKTEQARLTSAPVQYQENIWGSGERRGSLKEIKEITLFSAFPSQESSKAQEEIASDIASFADMPSPNMVSGSGPVSASTKYSHFTSFLSSPSCPLPPPSSSSSSSLSKANENNFLRNFTDPLSINQTPSPPSSPPPLSPPASQPNSLSSLPPNLSPSPSHVNFFASHSPLSLNPPSLELPELLTPTPTTSDYFPDTEQDRSDYYSWQEVGGAVGGIKEGRLEGRALGTVPGVEGSNPAEGRNVNRTQVAEERTKTDRIEGEETERSKPAASQRANHTCLDISTIYDPAEEYSDLDAEGAGSGGLAEAVSRVIRRSMRRMKRLRLSGRRSPNRKSVLEPEEGNINSNLSEETAVRRALPYEPSMGLATVRSPAAASIIVTSLVAALAPPPLHAPRELLDPPPGIDSVVNDRYDEGIQTTNETSGASRRTRRRQRRLWGDGGGGAGERGREGRSREGGGRSREGRNRRSSYDNIIASPSVITPSAPPTSLEVEIGGYASAPVSLLIPDDEQILQVTVPEGRDSRIDPQSGSMIPSAPPSLELILPTSMQSWDSATLIPRPSFNSRRRNSNTNNDNSDNSHPSESVTQTQVSPVSSPTSSILSPVASPVSSNPSVTNFPSVVSATGTPIAVTNGSESRAVPRGRRNRDVRLGLAGREVVGGGGREVGGGGREAGGGGRSEGVDGTARNTRHERRRQRRRRTPNDTNNNTNNSNNNRSTTAEASTQPNNNRNRNNNNNNARNNTRQSPRRTHNAASPGLTFESERLRVQGGTWSHNQSGLMASLAVTVTTFNISRFAVLGAKFGWPFVVQWIIISLVLGLPLMTFHVTIGQYLGAGVIDMWRISPIFQGVGYSLIIAQALVGVYCCVPVAWLFIFFRDSFITHNNMFRWADCRYVNCSSYNNFSTIIIIGVPKYFNSLVLQRSDEETSWLQELGSIKFDLAVNIALIWIITLIALSKGNRSYGRVAYIVFLLPLLGYLIVCVYLASWTKYDIYMNLSASINELFRTSQSWMAASREVFLVWGFHGAVLQQMSAHNKKGHPLYRDTTVLAIITTLALVLAAITGSSCLAGLQENKLYYKPSSFENSETVKFLSETTRRPESDFDFEAFSKQFPIVSNISPQLWADYIHYDNFYAGIRIRPPNLGVGKSPDIERSGYQSLRLGTELFPALLAVNNAQQISPFWSSLFYFSLLLFGIAQQLAVWRTVVEAVIRINRERLQAWEIFITFLCCLFGFSAALPMATGAGIHILYFLDYVLSCGWWLMIIQLVQIFALLFVRGKPYSGQDVVGELMGKNEQCRSLWLGPLTSFSWNIIVPVGLLVLSISSFKSGQYRDVFDWGDESYWPVWVRQLASALQLFPILLVPLVGLMQTCRYLMATDDDLFEKIQLLYRPSLRQRSTASSNASGSSTYGEDSEREVTSSPQESQEEELSTPRPYSDPPPKYTPPPSYSTATGIRFAKLLHHSLRQSMRRLRDTLRNSNEANLNRENEETPTENICAPPEVSARRETPYIPPPDYVTVVGEYNTQRINNSNSNNSSNSTSSTADPPPLYATLDPLRRQRALAAMADATSSTSIIKSDVEAELPRPTTPILQRNSSARGSSLRRNLASGVRRSARRIAVTLGVRNGQEDDSTLVSSEELSVQEGETRDTEEYHPHAYTNFEMISQSEA